MCAACGAAATDASSYIYYRYRQAEWCLVKYNECLGPITSDLCSVRYTICANVINARIKLAVLFLLATIKILI